LDPLRDRTRDRRLHCGGVRRRTSSDTEWVAAVESWSLRGRNKDGPEDRSSGPSFFCHGGCNVDEKALTPPPLSRCDGRGEQLFPPLLPQRRERGAAFSPSP